MPEPTPMLRSTTSHAAYAAARQACNAVPPLWDLNNYVAVNPFLGFSDTPFVKAAAAITDGLNASPLPPTDYYRQQFKSGAFNRQHLFAAARRTGREPEHVEEILNGRTAAPTRQPETILSFAERFDRLHGTHWNDALLRSISRWCAVYAAEGGSSWRLPLAQESLYRSWQMAAQVDRTLEIAGLRGWRKCIANLPDSAAEALPYALDQLTLADDEWEPYLYHLFAGLYGWASFFRLASWPGTAEMGSRIADLLTIRLCADLAIVKCLPWAPDTETVDARPPAEDEAHRETLQEALEEGYVSPVLAALNPPQNAAANRPAIQAAFCIDVRSEPMRRHLERAEPVIETIGFAGFFGLSLDWQTNGQSSARCPVLLKPGLPVCASQSPAKAPGAAVFKALPSTPVAAFSFVETLGLGFGLAMIRDLFSPAASPDAGEATVPFAIDSQKVPLETRATLAAGILTNMGIKHRMGRLVLLCGHESHSANNPHAAGLDCGACGGHGGAINARVAATLLNDADVRKVLAQRDISIPNDTLFIAGVHDTSADQVTLLDRQTIPPTHQTDVKTLQLALATASQATQTERAAGLGLSSTSPATLKNQIGRRARDIAQVRPEWGLAGNAAFIAARRQRTRGVNLQSRSFLHDYDYRNDPDESILTLILCAPMVVASWINLQYFASTVDNHFYGAGTKTLHNAVGTRGVVLGNGGDLRTGLAAQSVHAPDGSWYHQPLRLHVIVEAPADRIERIVNAQKAVGDLVNNGWVKLFALDPESSAVQRWIPQHGWEHQTASHRSENRLVTTAS